MYNTHASGARHSLADVPVEMPLDVLLTLPDYVTDDPAAPIFNLPAAAARLLGRFGWERASKILNARIWAPAWTSERIQRFATSPFSERPELFQGVPASRLAVSDFPGTGALRDLERPDFPEFEIIHFIGAAEWKDGDRALRMSEREKWWLHGRTLHAALRAAGTRLLILQVASRQIPEAGDLAQSIVDLGGPAVLAVTSSNPGLVNAYFVDFYADIVHNQPLEFASRPEPWMDQSGIGLTVDLYYGQGGSDLLRFDRWLESLRERAHELTREVESAAARHSTEVSSLRGRTEPYLHRSQVQSLDSRLGAATERLGSLRENVAEISGHLESSLNWAHESGGAEPLSSIAEIVPNLEAEAAEIARLYPELQAEVEAIVENTPRVLNANFGDPTAGRVLTPLEGLITGREYDLLVDVGPRWNTIPTIVSGHAEFPADSLPPDASGHVIDIVLVSDDFEPHLVSAKMWLPRARGRSHPWLEDAPAPTSGPVKLQVTAPAIENPRAQSREASGRLFLYYENNLLQSATVTVGVVREPGVALARQNQVEVDYALTGTFRDVDSNFGQRAIRFAGDDTAGSHPVRLNITVNSDGRGTHRILVRGRDELAPAWTTYDPAAALEALRAARRTISDCFWKRDDAGKFVLDQREQRVPGLDERNGKPRRQFYFDLFFLAKVGNRLYNEMFHLLRPESGEGDRAAWERQFRRRLETSGVVQVARIESAPTQYAFPWGLLYEYPLPGPSNRWHWCDVLSREWSKDGLRNGPIASACPFKDQSWHAEDVLCPYGFWGLKHVIEQPLAAVQLDGTALRGAVNEIPVPGEINLSVGWTRDVALNLSHIDAHVQRLSRTRGVRLAGPPPNPADDRDTVRAVLSAPNLVYFICHCERDPAENQPYLYVGPRDENPTRKIYVNTITDWVRTTLGEWRRLKPLVFVNGCHTGELEPGEILNFVSAFGLAGAAGIIGTEVSVPLRVAVEIAEKLFEKIVASEGGKVGQAMREVRWELTNKGNLLGLCYTPHCLADLRFVHGASGDAVT